MSVIVYGIKNCDTVQRALQALDAAGIAYQFHDFKKQGLDAATAQRWIDALGVDVVVNRKGTTWRQLDASVQAKVSDAASARSLMLAHPSVIKRPVLVAGDARQVTVGVNEEAWSRVVT